MEGYTHPRPDGSTPVLVIGLGNPLLGDDGVGWRVAERVCRLAEGEALPVEVDCLAVGGLRLMERLIGYERVILIDALTTGQSPLGHVHCFQLDDLPDPGAGHLTCAHDTTLQTALKVGRALGAVLPEQIMVVTVEARQVYDFSDRLTPPVELALEPAAQAVMALLHQILYKEDNHHGIS